MSIISATPSLTTPYPGFRPFERHEAPIFFGRYDQIVEMLHRLETRRFLAVVGTSGSGKSSLVRAGLLPALDEGFLFEACSEWCVVAIRPGEDPFRALAAALSAALGQDAQERRALIHAILLSGAHGLTQVVNDAGLPSGTNVLLVVDQFEELFRFRSAAPADRKESANSHRSKYEERNSANAFVNLLLETVRGQSGQTASKLAESGGEDSFGSRPKYPVYIVLTMRSEFIGYCDAFLGLPEAISESQFLTPRMDRDQLKESIVRPLDLFEARAEPGLVNRVLNDADSDQDALPLMEHALLRTWQKAKERYQGKAAESSQHIELTIEDYESVGEFKDALSIHADEAYNEVGCDPEQGAHYQRVSQLLFRALTAETSEGMRVRNPIKLAEAASIAGATVEQVLHIVEVFQQEGRNFITYSPRDQPLGPNSTLDIGHESLVRRWKILGDWISDEQKDAETYKQISYHARRWKQSEKTQARLWKPPSLDDAISWREKLKPTEAWARRYNNDFSFCMEFLDASIAETTAARENLIAEHHGQTLGDRFLGYLFGYDFYICYTWKDARQYGTALAKELQLTGFRCFIDSEQYARGANWRKEAARTLNRSLRLLLIVSPAAFESAQVAYETRVFAERKRPIIPIVFEGVKDSSRESPVARAISDLVRIREDFDQLAVGPSDSAIASIRSASRITASKTRERFLRLLTIIFGVLFCISVITSIFAIYQKDLAIRSLNRARDAENVARKSRQAALEGLKQQLASYTRATEICGRIAAAAENSGANAAQRKEEVRKAFGELAASKRPIVFTDTIATQVRNLQQTIEMWDPSNQNSTDSLMQAALMVAQEYGRTWRGETADLSKDARELIEALIAMPIYEHALTITMALAGGQDTQKVRDAFERLYWGELVVIETREVESAMVVFRLALQGSQTARQEAAEALEAALKAELSRLQKSILPSVPSQPS
jgi:hypothetical protein